MTSPKITYILGAGRSGSTVLERLLASAPGVVGVGEVATLWRRPFADLTCSCGAPAPECEFWSDVRAKAGLSDAILQDLAEMEETTVRHRILLGDALRGAKWADREDAQCFIAHQSDLFGAIAEAADATHIIDSSKAGPRAWALSGIGGVSILHLRRNPGDVAASWRRVKHDPSLDGPMRRPSFPAIAREWLAAEMSARLLAAARPVIRMDYEMLTTFPNAALRHLGAIAKDVALSGHSFTPDPNYHSLNGNPDRFHRGQITLKPAAPPPLPRGDAAFAWLTGAALNLAAP